MPRDSSPSPFGSYSRASVGWIATSGFWVVGVLVGVPALAVWLLSSPRLGRPLPGRAGLPDRSEREGERDEGTAMRQALKIGPVEAVGLQGAQFVVRLDAARAQELWTAVRDGTVSAAGFTVDLSGAPSGSGYKLSWMAI